MTIQLYANNAKTTLSAPITATQTSITVAAGTGALFPSPTSGQSFQVTLVSASSSTVYEICTCTAVSSDTLTIVRGQEGTSGTPFTTGDIVANYDTALVMTNLVQSQQLQNQYYQFAVASGTANALTATIPSSLTTLPNGMYLTVVSAYANTGASTLQVTLGSTIQSSYPIVKGNNVTLVAGDIPGAGYPLQLNWSTSYSAFVLSNPATGILIASVPTGAIVQFPATTPPSGYLIAEGQLVSRATYAALWSFASSSGNLISESSWQAGQYGSFSTGDGSTNFRLPQYGGYFLRSLDNGNGIDPTRVLGSVQNDQNLSHTHNATSTSTSTVTDPSHFHGSAEILNSVAGSGSGRGITTGQTDPAFTGITVSTTTTTVNDTNGESESRPINISVLTCIKY